MFVSYLLFAYNHERFIEEALRSALAQDYGPMEIIVTDDCSTDGTASAIERVLASCSGNKPVRLIKNAANIGFARSIDQAVATARGDILVMAAGDDVSLPERTMRVAEAFEDRSVQCVFSNAHVVNGAGNVERLHYAERPPEKTIARSAKPFMGLLGAASAYRKAVFSEFAPLPAGLMHEDKVLPMRAAILGSVKYLDQPLVRYRRHADNVWHGAKGRVRRYEEWVRSDIRMARDTILVLRTRLDDITVGERLRPDRSQDFAVLGTITQAMLRPLEAKVAISDSSTVRGKVSAALEHLLSGDIQGLRPRWAFIKRNFLPSYYHRGIGKPARP